MDHKEVVAFTHAIDKTKFHLFEIAKGTDTYLHGLERDEFFEIIWFDDSSPDTTPGKKYIYLIPPFRSLGISLENKTGILIAFKREYLEEDDKEYALDVFKLFNLEGQYSLIQLDEVTNLNLEHVYQLLMSEWDNPIGTYLAIKALLKVFLLHLIRLKQNAFLSQDLNQKRVYQFCILLDQNFDKERKAPFYSNKLRISEKRLNQILREKMHKTITQLIHSRLILEAKRKLISSELTIKEISYVLNFEDQSYFSRFFKKQTGLTPEDFKKEVSGSRKL